MATVEKKTTVTEVVLTLTEEEARAVAVLAGASAGKESYRPTDEIYAALDNAGYGYPTEGYRQMRARLVEQPVWGQVYPDDDD